jgi:peroxiredoxin
MENSKIRRVAFVIVFCFLMTSLFATKAPDFTIETIDGRMLRSATLLENGPILLDFWFTACVPCQKALPHISDLVGRYPGLNVLAVSTDSPRLKDRVIQYVRSNRFAFTTGLDPAKTLQRLFNVTAMPRTIIIDTDGTIIYDHTGYKAGDEAKYHEILDNLFRVGADG